MEKIKVAIVYRSYGSDKNVSHAGLGICAINTCKTLNQYGINCEVWPMESVHALRKQLKESCHITHVVIQAPWINFPDMFSLSKEFYDVQFGINCHSNVGFLQTDPHSMTLMLDMLELEQITYNVHACSNNTDFAHWIHDAYQAPCTILPNLYYLDQHVHAHRPLWRGGILRIGIFGAPRPQKNMMTGVAGAIEIAQLLKAHTEIWVNRGRDETHGKTILDACKRAIDRNPYTTYKELPWAPWPQFRNFLGSMNLNIQCSYSESFNQVCSDSIATGVPVVVSSAIRWAPHNWKADADSAESIAHIGKMLLSNPFTQKEGVNALRDHNEKGLILWERYLLGRHFKKSVVSVRSATY